MGDDTDRRLPTIYLASPYSHPDEPVMCRRFGTACRAAAALMGRGYVVFSPIAHTHPIAELGYLPRGWEFWRRFDEFFLAACDELWVLNDPGWDRSVGVTAEIQIAGRLGKPTKLFSPPDSVMDLPGAVATGGRSNARRS